MCQTLIVEYSCGCIKDQISIPCDKPKAICTHLSKIFDKDVLNYPCSQHSNYTARGATQTTKSNIQRSTSLNVPSMSQPLRRKPQGITTQPRRPQKLDAPTIGGLGGLEKKLQAMAVTSSGIQRSQSSRVADRAAPGRSDVGSIPDRFGRPPETPAAAIPRRKPLAANVMSIPVYDNGTDASHQQAQRLKNSPTTVKSEFAIPDRSSSKRTTNLSSNTSTTAVSSKGSNYTDSTLYLRPAPLKIDKRRHGQLPATPKQNTQEEARKRMLHKNSEELFATMYQPPSVPLSTLHTIGKSGPGAAEQSKAKARDAVRRLEEEKQASEKRMLRAQRAVDSGRWSMYKSCPEIDALNRSERQQINQYIQKKRDREDGMRSQGPTRTYSQRSKPSDGGSRKKGKNTCDVM